MVVECWVIVIILGIASYMFVRSGKKAWATGTLPLMLVPFVSIIYSPIGRSLMEHGATFENPLRIALYIAAFVAASIWVIFWARRLPTGRSKYSYIFVSIAFTLILVLVLIKEVAIHLP